jgi:hypothetical protein
MTTLNAAGSQSKILCRTGCRLEDVNAPIAPL